MKKTKERAKILIGNSFPFSLVRCPKLLVENCRIGDLARKVKNAEVVSFWGHENTRAIAEQLLGASLLPRMERPALSVSEKGLPMLYGDVFSECWLLSPDYQAGFRPAIGVEVLPSQIVGWQVLKLSWKIGERLSNVR